MTDTLNHVPVARRRKLGGMQKFIADKLVESLHTAASVTTMAEIPATPLQKAREQWRRKGVHVSLTHQMIQAVARCLERHPQLNGVIHDGMVHEYGEINISLALSLPNGDLQTAVIRQANRKTVPDIAEETGRLVQLAHDGQLGLSHVRGGTFTLSNYGQLKHVVWATPIISPGQSGVLGVGRVRPGWVMDDHGADHQVAPIIPLSLTYDHRIINGVPAGHFLEDLAQIMMNPTMET